ncbi:DUF1173 family protein [Spirillospora sp. CA-128828]|uniref:DUF1173 family protein n=1 Tax=Spirillospora sp. CA-128828 TaxID=3240033 RepID=UPI003D941B8C
MRPSTPEDGPQRNNTFLDGSAGRVRLADRVVSLAAIRHDPTRFTRLLARARSESGHAECLCQAPALKLVIRSRGGRFHLAGWPGNGSQHALDCLFYKTSTELSGRSRYTVEAVNETVDGTALRLVVPLELSGSRILEETPNAPPRDASGAARAMTLLGLLHWLWEQAQLNLWHPAWRRGWSTCHARLTEQAGDCVVNGLDLGNTLYVVPPYRPQNADANAVAFTTFCGRLGGLGRRQQRGLILGELKNERLTRHGTRFTLRHHRGALFASSAVSGRTRRSYPAAFSAAAINAVNGARRIGLFVVERTQRDYLAIVEMAVILTNELWIPGESFYEVVMADRIIAAGRSFTKPVRYDGDVVFPDFVLTDTKSPVYVEVYGVRGRAEYERRKQAKQEHYRAIGADVIEWDVAEPLPDVPPSVKGLRAVRAWQR